MCFHQGEKQVAIDGSSFAAKKAQPFLKTEGVGAGAGADAANCCHSKLPRK